MDKEYAAIIIKPDSIRDLLEGNIMQDLLDFEIEIIWRNYRKLSEGFVGLIYKKYMDNPIFPSAVKAMVNGLSLVILARGENIYGRLPEIKGKMNTGGIRLKYKIKSKEELVSAGYTGRELQDILAENRLHTAENVEETIMICALYMASYDKDQLAAIAPEIYQRIKGFTSPSLLNFQYGQNPSMLLISN